MVKIKKLFEFKENFDNERNNILHKSFFNVLIIYNLKRVRK